MLDVHPLLALLLLGALIGTTAILAWAGRSTSDDHPLPSPRSRVTIQRADRASHEQLGATTPNINRGPFRGV